MTSDVERLVALTGWTGLKGASFDWGAVRAELGTDLPPDYVHLVDTFGVGTFDDAITLLEPACPNLHFDLVRIIKERQWALSYYLEDDSIEDPIPENEVPLSIRGGDPIMTWAVTDFPIYFYWRCSPWDDPAKWPVAVNVLGEEWYEFPMTATELLLGALSGSVNLANFRGVLPRPEHTFVPISAWGA